MISQITLSIRVLDRVVDQIVMYSDVVSDIIQEIHREQKLSELPQEWVLRSGSTVLSASSMIGEAWENAGRPAPFVVTLQLFDSVGALGVEEYDYELSETATSLADKDGDEDEMISSDDESAEADRRSALPPAPATTESKKEKAAPPPEPLGMSLPAPAAEAPPEGGMFGSPRSRAQVPQQQRQDQQQWLPAPSVAASAILTRSAPVEIATRRATVRYYYKMNPQRSYPLLVILSADEIREIVKRRVTQTTSETFTVDTSTGIEIEPVLPGCQCYPLKATVSAASTEPVTTTFWIVPQLYGRVQGAKVIVRQNGQVLTEIPLQAKVVEKTLAYSLAGLSFVMPYVTEAAKANRVDFASQKAEGFPVYRMAMNWIADYLQPEWVGLGLLLLAGVVYWSMRARRRDVFWDVEKN